MWWDPALPDIQPTVPFWIYYMENAEHHHYIFTGETKPHKLNKHNLIDHLHSSVVVAKGRKADIFRKAK